MFDSYPDFGRMQFMQSQAMLAQEFASKALCIRAKACATSGSPYAKKHVLRAKLYAVFARRLKAAAGRFDSSR